MTIEERKDNELNLESIDNDLRMERVRQTAEKLGWEHFGRSVRRNLLEKRYTLDARTRLDVLSSLDFMKQNMPIDEAVNVAQRIKQLADSLGENCSVSAVPGGFCVKNADVTIEIGVADENIIACKVGYFGQPLFDAPEALELMKEGEFTQFRDSIAGILSILPKEISVHDKNSTKDALRALEQLLIRDAADSSFAAINTSKYGFYSPRTEIRPGRLYFVAEPMFVRYAEKEKKSHADSSYLDMLPYFEISFVKHDKPCKLPISSQNGEWTEFKEASVCVCLRFKHAFLFSQQTIRKLGHIVPKSPLIRHYVNFYRFMAARPNTKKNLEMLTQFPEDDDVQQKFNVDARKLMKEDDAVVVEMFLSDLRDLPRVVEILRAEWKHASLWESVLAMCEPLKKTEAKQVRAAEFDLTVRRNEFHLQFNTGYGNMTMQIAEKSPSHYTVKTTAILTGDSPSEKLDKSLTEKLNSTWSIPSTLSFAVSELDCQLVSVQSPLKSLSLDNAVDFDKLHQAWLSPNIASSTALKSEPVKRVAKVSKQVVLERGPAIRPTELVYTREDDSEFRGALLASFGEVDPYYVRTSTIGRTRAQPPPKRNESHLSSLDQMAADLEADRHRQQEMHRMSLLESARVHMKQSIGAAHAVGLASHQPPSQSPAPGPMRHQFPPGFEQTAAPYEATADGKKPRKSRAKKGAEEGAGRGKGGRKGRGAAGAVGAAGARKSSGVAENPYGLDMRPPPLQRSFSDFLSAGHMNQQQMAQYQHMQQMQQYQQSQQMRMQQQQQQQMQSPKYTPSTAYTEEESESKRIADEECDPPPPPKSAGTPRSIPPQLGNPMVGYPGMPLQSPNHLPLTPSPLSAPPKPFSPEQQHFGMKMRESTYWKELERIDVKPDVALLKQQMAAQSSSQPTSSTEPSTSTAEPPKATPKKKMGLEATISKIRGQQEQALQKMQQQQQSTPEAEQQEKEKTPQPAFDQSGPPPLLAPHQLDRARNLMDVFDDDSEDTSPGAPDVKPSVSALQKALSGSSSDSPGPPPPLLMPNLKREVEEEPEKEKLVLKIPKTMKSSSSGESPKPKTKEDRKDKDRDRDRDRDKDRDGDRDREREKEDKAQKEKEKKERERERRRQRDRERAEQKRAEKEKSDSGKEKEPTTSKKRKLDKKEEKDRREPDRKKGRSDYNKTTTTSMIPTLSLKNFRIPKKDTADEDKKDAKEEGPSTSTPAPGPSAPPPESVSKKEPAPAPISRKESTTSVAAPPLQRKESFSALSGPFPPADHREPPTKKKAIPPPSGPPPGVYPGPPNMGPNPTGRAGGRNKQPMPPPPPSMMRGGPPPDQMYRDRAGGMRGYPPSSHYHGNSSSSAKQVASYAQGLPPGMGPPAVKPHGGNYQASQWVRPPTHRDSHGYHGMPPLGPPQLQREQPSHPPPQMIPLPRDPPVLRENPRERTRGDDDGPDSPEEGTLRIDDE